MNHELQKKLQAAIDAAFHSRTLCREDLVEIMEMARVLFSLDCVRLVTNQEYRYQLDLMVDCRTEGTRVDPGKNVLLTKEQYEHLTEIFAAQPICDRQLPELRAAYSGQVLRGAIMRGRKLYGLVVFGREKEADWTEEEKTVLSDISYLMLILFGLNQMNEEQLRYEQEREKFDSEEIPCGFFLNLKSGMCHVIKLAPHLEHLLGEWDRYDVMLEEYTGRFVDPIYSRKIEERFTVEALKKSLSLQQTTVFMDFPRVAEGSVSWFRYTAELVGCDADGTPAKAYFYFRNITQDVRISSVTALNETAYAVISSIDLDTEQYAVYVDNLDEESRNSEVYSIGSYRELLKETAESAVDPEYADRFLELFMPEQLRAHFAESEERIRYEFPYRMKQSLYWVRMEAVKTQHFAENGKKIVLYFTDITEQKKREQQLQTVSRDLEKERERALEAKLQAMIDPLTGAYNRAGFEQAVREYMEETIPIGFVLLDIDNFKALNDTYGHEFGDEVLILLAKRLQAMFRNEDKVFRLGGDEFALLLYGCSCDAWESLKMKFSGLHNYLKEMIRKDVDVTISAGFCQSDNGYEEQMFKLADEALYHTKSAGRAGITQIGADHEIKNSWHDRELTERGNAIPRATIGNWRVEIDEQERKRLFLDETAHIILEIPNVLTPEESFAFWKKRIVERHRELYMEIIERLKTIGQAECSYHWNHPTRGEITLRIGGKSRENRGTREIFGYLQEIRESDVVLSYDDGQFLMEAMNRIYFCTYYFDLETKEYFIIKGHENEKDVRERHENIDRTFEQFVQSFVHPDHQKKVAEFADLETLPERLAGKAYIECEYLSHSALGWCSTRIMPVKWDENGKLTRAVSMSACIDEAKRAEIEREESIKEAMRVQIRIGEMTSKSEILQSGTMDKKTGAIRTWKDYLNGIKDREYPLEALKEKGRGQIYEEDLAVYEESFDLERICRMVEKNGSFLFNVRMKTPQNELRVIACHFEPLRADESRLMVVAEDITNAIPEGIEWMSQFEILEKVGEAVAIFDYDSYDIVYLNKTARDLLGMDLKTLRKKKCYELFSDRNGPCSFCDKVILDDGGNGFMCREVKGTGKTFLLHGSPIEINGRKYRVEQAVPAVDARREPEQSDDPVL